MKFNRFPTALVLAGALTMGGCATDPAMDTAEASEPQYTDEELRVMVERQITNDPRLPAHEIGVFADAEAGQVTLDGMVTTEEFRVRAEEMAYMVMPDIVVINRIDVVPVGMPEESYTDEMATSIRTRAQETGEKIGDSLKDAWIYSSVMAGLALDDDTPARNINVDVENQVVTLRGEVRSDYSKREAERIASSTTGVKSVTNLLNVT